MKWLIVSAMLLASLGAAGFSDQDATADADHATESGLDVRDVLDVLDVEQNSEIAAPAGEGEIAAPAGEDEIAAPAGEADGPLILIDPGHGGSNTGSPGVGDGFFEKRLTLPMSRSLAERLRKRGYRVRLTRDRDEYLTLRQRVRHANQIGADLFISVHANATEAHAQRGYETFVLTPRALDVDSRVLRISDGAARPDVDPSTALLLDDLERGAAQVPAAALAEQIQAEMRAIRGKAGDRGVRQDAMHVLLGATMPAVLVEIGFIDHAIEGPELRQQKIQDQICDALTEAIARALPVE